MSDPDAQQPGQQPDHDADPPPEQARAVEAEELVAFARDLEAEAPRQRRAPVRRRGRVIHEGEVLDDDAQLPVRVRSESEEPPGHDPDEQESAEHGAGMLDASGAPIDGGATRGAGPVPDAPVPTPGSGPSTPPGAAPRVPADAAPPPGAAHTPDAAAFLALAVGTYLDGVDRYGHESEITRDRLTQLRATLALYQGPAG